MIAKPQSYLVDREGNRVGVVLDLSDYQALLEDTNRRGRAEDWPVQKEPIMKKSATRKLVLSRESIRQLAAIPGLDAVQGGSGSECTQGPSNCGPCEATRPC
jgi:hypothetical protein